MTSEQRVWTPDFFRAFVVLLGISLVFITLMSFMALYAVKAFAVGDSAAGFAASSFVIGGASARLVIGKYLDFIGRKRTLIITLLVFIGCSLLYPVVDHFALLIIVRIIHGAGFGVASTAITSTVISLLPPHRLSEGLGYFTLAGTVANAVGPLAAIQLGENASAVWVFLFTALCAVIGLIAVVMMTIDERTPSPEEYAHRWKFRPSDLIDVDVLPIAVVGLLTTMGFSVVMTYLPVYLVGLEMVATASVFFIIWALGMLAVRLFAGRLQDRYGPNAVLPAALVSLAAGLLVIGMATDVWHFMVAAALGGMGHGVALPSLQTVGVQRAHPDRIPIATSTHYLALDSGLAVGPVALGFTIALAGYQGLYFAGAGIVTVGLLVYWFAHGRRGHVPHRST